ncbi:MAG TPA: hypothetical protein VMA95_22215, partial [Streptosporangiaceae bacterium]|nr:hypothetical protein [Streptosporangiaceae bacterium]
MTSNQDGAPTALIAAEIRALRKGRGIRSSDLERRLGQNLRELIGPGDGDVDRRQVLSNELAAQAAKLPEDLRIAV